MPAPAWAPKAGRLKGGLGSASFRLTGRRHGRRDRRGQQLGRGGRGPIAAASGRRRTEPCPASWRPAAADAATGRAIRRTLALQDSGAGANTTIAVVATDAVLGKGGGRRLAIMAQDGLARAIRPIHTPFDGDTVFALATGDGPPSEPAALLRLGHAAADCLARAVMRAVTMAEPLAGVPNWRQSWRPQGAA